MLEHVCICDYVVFVLHTASGDLGRWLPFNPLRMLFCDWPLAFCVELGILKEDIHAEIRLCHYFLNCDQP